MGRRALRQVDPRIDLSRHLHVPASIPDPWDARYFFERSAPLEIEVGSGKGLFISTEPAARPAHNYIGIEIAPRYARHAAARIARRGLPNACMIAGDAATLFQNRIPAASVTAVHVYFPDPWWKKRHRKRRIVRPDFLQQVERVLLPGGRFHLWTDVQEYFEESLQTISQSVPWHGPFPVPSHDASHDLDYRTHFERRMRLHSHPVYRTEYQKNTLICLDRSPSSGAPTATRD